MSIAMSTFKALYGRSPPSLIRLGHNTTPIDSLDQLLRERNAILDDLQYHLLRAQQQMTKWANKKRRDISFDMGDLYI